MVQCFNAQSYCGACWRTAILTLYWAGSVEFESERGRWCFSDAFTPALQIMKGRALAAKRKIAGGVLAFVGFMLSPLSWWNDLFVNVPLALVFAWVVSAFDKRAFGVAVVVGYWLTNVLGFVLMHKGAQKLLTEQDKRYSRRDLLKDVG